MNTNTNPNLTPSGKRIFYWNNVPAVAIAPRRLAACAHAAQNCGTFERRGPTGQPEPAPSQRTENGWITTTENGAQVERRVEHFQTKATVKIGDLLFIELYRDVAPEDIVPILPQGELTVQSHSTPPVGVNLQWLSRTRQAWLDAGYPPNSADNYAPMTLTLTGYSRILADGGDSGSLVFTDSFLVGFVSDNHPSGFRFVRPHHDLSNYGFPTTPLPSVPVVEPVSAPVSVPWTPLIPAPISVPAPVSEPTETPDKNGLVTPDPDTTPALIALGFRQIPSTDLVKWKFIELYKRIPADLIAEQMVTQTIGELRSTEELAQIAKLLA
jgi:hypothetical protein